MSLLPVAFQDLLDLAHFTEHCGGVGAFGHCEVNARRFYLPGGEEGNGEQDNQVEAGADDADAGEQGNQAMAQGPDERRGVDALEPGAVVARCGVRIGSVGCHIVAAEEGGAEHGDGGEGDKS